MTSANTYTDQSYVVYHITYSGDKLPSKFNSNITPSNYIGSTSLEQINKGYMGSVVSKKYKVLWESELKQNPQLFKLEIISYHDTRSDATYKELQIQKLFNVVKNPLFVNMSLAQKHGCFGTDNPAHNKGKSPSEETKAKLSASRKGKQFSDKHKANISAANKGKQFSDKHKANISASKKGKTLSEKTKAKMSASRKGNTHSNETKIKISLAAKNRTPEQKAIIKAKKQITRELNKNIKNL